MFVRLRICLFALHYEVCMFLISSHPSSNKQNGVRQITDRLILVMLPQRIRGA